MELIDFYNNNKDNCANNDNNGDEDDEDDDDDITSYEMYRQEIENFKENLELNDDHDENKMKSDAIRVENENDSKIYSITSTRYNNSNFEYNIVKSYDDNRVLNDRRLIMNLNNFQLYSIKCSSQASCFETLQTDVKPYMRKIVVSWMLEVCQEEKSDKLVFPLAVYILDKYLYSQRINRNVFQLIASVCLFLSSKIFNVFPITAERLVLFSDFSIDTPSIIVRKHHIYVFINASYKYFL